MDKPFELMLQLHAEVEAVPVESAPSADPTPSADTATPAEPSSNSSNEMVTRNGQPASFGLRVDKVTGRKSVVMLNRGGDEPEDAPTQQVEPVPQAQQQQPTALFTPANTAPVEPYHTTEELLGAIRAGNVDERRVPMEQAFAYANYKQQVAQQQEQQRQVMEQAQQPNHEAEERVNFFTRVDSLAKQAALQDLNLTEEELETAEFTDDEDLQARAAQYDTSMAWHRSAIMEQVRQEQLKAQQAQQRVASLYADINNKVAEYRAKEPEFENINVMMNNFYTELPYNEAVQYAEAINAYNSGNITEEQAQRLQTYYDKARTVYYARKNNLGTIYTPHPKVPVVEQHGSAGTNYSDNVVTKSQLRNASDYRTRRALIGQILNHRR